MHKDLLALMRAERSVRLHLGLTMAAAVLAGLLVLVQAELLAGVLSGRFAPAAAGARWRRWRGWWECGRCWPGRRASSPGAPPPA
ncbi:hypothetical protein ACFQ0B_61330 [Nonomuraea thailandensis]